MYPLVQIVNYDPAAVQQSKRRGQGKGSNSKHRGGGVQIFTNNFFSRDNLIKIFIFSDRLRSIFFFFFFFVICFFVTCTSRSTALVWKQYNSQSHYISDSKSVLEKYLINLTMHCILSKLNLLSRLLWDVIIASITNYIQRWGASRASFFWYDTDFSKI